MNVVVNCAPSEFGLSVAAYEKLIEWGVPVVGPDDAATRDLQELFILDVSLMPGMVVSPNPEDAERAAAWIHSDYRYECFALNFIPTRSHPLILRVVEELQGAAGAPGTRLGVVIVPDNIDPLTLILTRDGAGWEVIAWPTTGD